MSIGSIGSIPPPRTWVYTSTTRTEIDRELARSKAARLRRKRSTTVVFQKIHKGLYISHEHGMTLSHEPTWSRDVGRKWELTWQESYMGLMAPSKQHKKFDTVADARAYANALIARG